MFDSFLNLLLQHLLWVLDVIDHFLSLSTYLEYPVICEPLNLLSCYILSEDFYLLCDHSLLDSRDPVVECFQDFADEPFNLLLTNPLCHSGCHVHKVIEQLMPLLFPFFHRFLEHFLLLHEYVLPCHILCIHMASPLEIQCQLSGELTNVIVESSDLYLCPREYLRYCFGKRKLFENTLFYDPVELGEKQSE